jgi:hypothetical protein
VNLTLFRPALFLVSFVELVTLTQFSPLGARSELGYNYEVPVSRFICALLRLVLTATPQVCDHCHNLLATQ